MDTGAACPKSDSCEAFDSSLDMKDRGDFANEVSKCS
jgi:hypothetical protein